MHRIANASRILHWLLSVCWFAAFASPAAEPDFSRYFTNKDGCVLVYDLKADKLIHRFNAPRCEWRMPPCSTFKVALSLMAFDRNILKDETTTYRWDGLDHGNPVWNRDASAADWMKNSVFWYSQRLTPQLGTPTIKKYLADFKYGNQDTSGELTHFWLDSTLKISPDEELEFMKRLWRDDFAVAKRALELTRKIMYLETSSSGTVLSGKTGSGHLHPGSNDHLGIGWFIGHISGNSGEYLIVINFSDQTPNPDYPGLTAKKIGLEILTDLKLY